MRTWEYIQVQVSHDRFAVISPQGPYLSEDQYRSMDAQGKKVVEDKLWYWEPGMARMRFLLMLLNTLGSQGWELIGNVDSGALLDLYLILKRRRGNAKG